MFLVEGGDSGQPVNGTPLKPGVPWDFAWTSADPFRPLVGPRVTPRSTGRLKHPGGTAISDGYLVVGSNAFASIGTATTWTQVGVVVLDGVNGLSTLSTRPQGQAVLFSATNIDAIIWGSANVTMGGVPPTGIVHYVVRRVGSAHTCWINGKFFGSASNATTPGALTVLPAIGAQAGDGPNAGAGPMAATVGNSLVARTAAPLSDEWCIRASANAWAAVFDDDFAPSILPVSASSGSTGTSATTNAADTSSASGTTTVVGTSATTNAADTSSASGTTTVVGTSATTNAADTSEASGTVGGDVTGTSATTNAPDTSSASGWAGVVSGTSATTNADDISTAVGIGGPSRSGAGRASRKKRRVQVEIDGRIHEVTSEAEARELLEQAKAEAEQAAELAISRATKAQKRPTRKVLADARKSLQVPTISAPEYQSMVDSMLGDIRDLYQSTLETIEISALLRRKEREDEDDEDVLMLLL